jgi:hypothetical protein
MTDDASRKASPLTEGLGAGAGGDMGNNPDHARAHQQTPEEREALDTALGLWVCPKRSRATCSKTAGVCSRLVAWSKPSACQPEVPAGVMAIDWLVLPPEKPFPPLFPMT